MTGAALPDVEFWSGRRVLVTGHTGFKGAWLTCWLRHLGADVLGVSLPGAVSQPSLWEELRLDDVRDVRGDVSKAGPWTEDVRSFGPEVVLHLAAQPLVSVGWAEPAVTFETNVMGTVRVLDLVRSLPGVLATVVVTTDKVYDPSQPPPHQETDALGGRDPYSASKAAAELVVGAWPAGTPRATARAGNVIGGGDWAEDRLLPDLVRAWSAGEAPVLRSPDGIRPWQHVLEPLRGYLLLAQSLAVREQVPAAVNFGPSDAQTVNVRTLADQAARDWVSAGGTVPEPAWTPLDATSYEETSELVLASGGAAAALDWMALLDWRTALRLTLEWYRESAQGVAASVLVGRQLQEYTALAQGENR